MKISAAKYEGGKLILETMDADARKLVYNFKPGDYQLVKAKKPRSLDANAYCFALIDKIATAINMSKEEVYRNAIREIGGVSDTVCVQNEAVDSLRSGWSRNGLGWQTETFPSKIEGCTNVVLYYGSSSYDTRQMSRLIDHIVQDCKALGIETMTEREISLLKERWGE